MKNVSKKLLLGAAVIALGNLAQAKDRYLVIYKSEQGFAAMNNYMRTVESPVKLQKSLKNIKGMVLQTKNPNALEVLRNHPEVASIEAETFSPTPKPINGFKISRVNRLKSETPVIDVPSEENQAPVVEVPHLTEGIATPWGILAVKAAPAWEASQAGKNARVLILDTGIDPKHPALVPNFEKGRNFFEDIGGLDPQNYIDEEGHGTHVAGTIAASYNAENGFTGVAPLAKILMGRVCGGLGCSNIAVAEGIDWGIDEKVDVISMSLGGPYSSSVERYAVADAEKAGVIVVAASGNSGIGRVSFPAALPTAIAVGAVDSSIVKTSFSQWGPELDIVAPGASVVSSVPQGTGRGSHVELVVNGVRAQVKSSAFSGTKIFSTPRVGDLVPAGLGKKEDLAKVNVAGKIALISRGEITFAEKVGNALKANAIGVVIYNNADGLMSGSLTEDGTELDAAVVMIEKTAGESLLAALNNGATASAEISTSVSDYASFDGTSMATPHVSGVIALMKSANKKLTPIQVRNIIKATAIPLAPNTQNEYGAGLIQADKAVEAALSVQ